MINGLIFVLIVVTLLASVGFVSVYATAPWQKNGLGRATMLWGLAMIVWCISGLVFSVYGVTPWYPYLRLAAYLATSSAMVTMLVQLIMVRRDNSTR